MRKFRDFLNVKRIIGPSGKRKSSWKKFWDDECDIRFNEFSQNYRSEEEAWFCILHDIEPPKCQICGELAKFTGQIRKSKNYFGYNTVCEHCSANKVTSKKEQISITKKSKTKEEKEEIISKTKQTKKEKYGDELYGCYGTKSFSDNLMKKYGDPHYNNHIKAKQTCLERYGVESNFQLPGFMEKSIKKKIEKYGNASNYEKTKQTNLERYGYEHIGQAKQAQIKSSMKKAQYIKELETEYDCLNEKKVYKLYGQGWKKFKFEKIFIYPYVFIKNSDIEIIKKYRDEGTHTNNYTSNKEKELFKYIKSIYKGKIIENNTSTILTKNNRYYELDIYLPEINTAFDFNGVYWHSIKFKDIYYHQRKLKACYDQGIRLIHIYEHEWDSNQYTIKDRINKVLNDDNYIDFNWIPVEEYENYNITKPIKIMIDKNKQIVDNEIDSKYILYNEGEFVKK